MLACYLLRNTTRCQNAEIVRFSDPESAKNCEMQVDIGGVYNHQRGRYDHTMPGFKTRPFQGRHLASSLGLVYTHYGVEAITNLTGFSDLKELQILQKRVYFDLLQAIDCIDNQVERCSSGVNYQDYTNWWMTVERFNLPWHLPPDKQREDERFLEAMEAIGESFSNALNYYVSRWLPWRFIVEKAYYTRKTFHPSGLFICMPEPCGWKTHLADLQNWNRHENVLYCIHPHLDKWIVQFTYDERHTRNEKLLFPIAWRGLKDQELEEKTQVKGLEYIHKKGYLAFASTLDAAKELCERLLPHISS